MRQLYLARYSTLECRSTSTPEYPLSSGNKKYTQVCMVLPVVRLRAVLEYRYRIPLVLHHHQSNQLCQEICQEHFRVLNLVQHTIDLLWRVLGSRFKVLLTNATNSGDIFWHHVRGEISACEAWKSKVLSTTWSFKCDVCRFSVFGRYSSRFWAVSTADCWKLVPRMAIYFGTKIVV
jgi:hypothetical protein